MRIRPHRCHRLVFTLLILAVNLARPLAAWDAPAHELIAEMAYAKLNPKAQQAVTALARELVNPERPYDAITLSCWMDDLRRNAAMPDHGRFLSWHYIDIPIDARDPMPSIEPGTDTDVHGNVVQALKRAISVLKGGSDPYITSKAMACAMVIHLVGDIHQPLHCATKYFFSHGELHQDNGGNKEDVINAPACNPKFNLHAFWDEAWRASFDDATGLIAIDPRYDEKHGHEPGQIDQLSASWRNGEPAPDGLLEPDIDVWAQESNTLARDFAYRELTTTENKKYCRLSREYVNKARTLARQRLVLAAARLATLLNETLGAP